MKIQFITKISNEKEFLQNIFLIIQTLLIIVTDVYFGLLVEFSSVRQVDIFSQKEANILVTDAVII